MRFHTLQLIDRYLGVPLCGLVSLVSPRRGAPDLSAARRILVVKMLGIGSLIVMSPLFRSLRRRFPSARIDLLTMDSHAEIGSLYGLADAVYGIDFSSPSRFLRSNLAVLRRIRGNRYDLVVDAEFYSRYTALLSSLAAPRAVSGFHSREIYRGRLREVNAYFNPYRHMAANFLELGIRVGAAPEDLSLTPPRLSRPLLAAVRETLARSGVDPDRPYVLLNPHASFNSSAIDRRWPLSHFAAVGAALAGRGYQVVAVDAPGQEEYTGLLAARSGGAVRRLAERFGLDRLLALIRGAFLLITNDSGPLHMAVSLSTPTFSFFGTESPVLYGYDYFPHTVFCLRLACSPCLSVLNFKRGTCELGLACLRGIAPEAVLAAFAKQEDSLRKFWEGRRDEAA